jgi:hypothetical protein
MPEKFEGTSSVHKSYRLYKNRGFGLVINVLLDWCCAVAGASGTILYLFVEYLFKDWVFCSEFMQDVDRFHG